MRLIPACAGTTKLLSEYSGQISAHPRLRGDHKNGHLCHQKPAGSSPPARGPRPHRGDQRRNMGLIPACAGTTFAFRRSRAGVGAHPRLRGDHFCLFDRDHFSFGSSPPARGPRFSIVLPRVSVRLIPACAGTTRGVIAYGENIRAHPRLRGDHVVEYTDGQSDTGSSPPARGPPSGESTNHLTRRLIPACAGTT